MIRTIADQYLAQNAGRRYPFADNAASAAGMTDAAFLDFRCTVAGSATGNVFRARLTKVVNATVASTAVRRFTVSVSVGSTNVATLAFDVPRNLAAGAAYTAYASDGLARGALTVSHAALSVSLSSTSNTVNVPFAATTVVGESLAVRSLQSAEAAADAKDKDDPPGRNAAARVVGEIFLAEGRNAEPYLDGSRLRVDMYKGAGLGERCQAPSASQTCGNVMFSINGERPGSGGDIRIVGGEGVTVTPLKDEHAVEIRMDDAVASRATSQCDRTCGR